MRKVAVSTEGIAADLYWDVALANLNQFPIACSNALFMRILNLVSDL